MYSEQRTLGQRVIETTGMITYCEVVIVLRDGVEIARTNERFTLYPGQPLKGIPAEVARIARAEWTPEVVTAYRASIRKPGQ